MLKALVGRLPKTGGPLSEIETSLTANTFASELFRVPLREIMSELFRIRLPESMLSRPKKCWS